MPGKADPQLGKKTSGADEISTLELHNMVAPLRELRADLAGRKVTMFVDIDAAWNALAKQRSYRDAALLALISL